MYQATSDSFWSQDKYFGRRLDADGLRRALVQFFASGGARRASVIEAILDRLRLLRKAVEQQDTFRFYSRYHNDHLHDGRHLTNYVIFCLLVQLPIDRLRRLWRKLRILPQPGLPFPQSGRPLQFGLRTSDRRRPAERQRLQTGQIQFRRPDSSAQKDGRPAPSAAGFRFALHHRYVERLLDGRHAVFQYQPAVGWQRTRVPNGKLQQHGIIRCLLLVQRRTF